MAVEFSIFLSSLRFCITGSAKKIIQMGSAALRPLHTRRNRFKPAKCKTSCSVPLDLSMAEWHGSRLQPVFNQFSTNFQHKFGTCSSSCRDLP
eukprot:s1156_g9.t1